MHGTRLTRSQGVVANGKWRKIIIIYGLIHVLFLPLLSDPKFIHNTLREIDACEGKIRLTLTRIWGDDNTDDENQFLRFPGDIEIHKDNLVYIADTGNNRILVFDRSGNFQGKIGQLGQGPGDLSGPNSITFTKDNLVVVSDANNYRVQFFDPKGKYISSFRTPETRPSFIEFTHKGDLALYSLQKASTSGTAISLYDAHGNIIGQLGKNSATNRRGNDAEGLHCVFDLQDNLFVSYYATPYYQKYSYNGKSLLVVSFQVPFPAPQVQPDSSTGLPRVKGEKKMMVSGGISVDRSGYVYLASVVRPRKKNEKFFLVSDNNGTPRRYPKGPYPEKTDRFRLLVFSPGGKVIAARKLDVFCDSIYVYEKSLFIIDTYMAMKIYEYEIDLDN